MRPAIFSRALRSSSSSGDAEVGAEQLEDRAGTGCCARGRRRAPRRRACRGRGSARGTRSTGGSSRCPPRPPRPPPGRCPPRVCSSASSSVRRSAARPTKRERPRAARDVEARARRADAGEAVDAHRSGDALHAELAEIVEREVAADQRGRRRRQVAGVRARRAPPCAARARRCGPAPCSPCAGRRRSCRPPPRPS